MVFFNFIFHYLPKLPNKIRVKNLFISEKSIKREFIVQDRLHSAYKKFLG
ncbi:hypothetical protein BAZMOX_13356_2 [methanotrophic endosymbiont of Bathymodiolus azoricus (Menez Gwen)]|nr:hypothetical protein BAZMOX_13356_2 [methanotrophic endosymbiont of Bathymodiolus azoricus (Menez Gwen)]